MAVSTGFSPSRVASTAPSAQPTTSPTRVVTVPEGSGQPTEASFPPRASTASTVEVFRLTRAPSPSGATRPWCGSPLSRSFSVIVPRESAWLSSSTASPESGKKTPVVPAVESIPVETAATPSPVTRPSVRGCDR